jgi:hypothetical protein
MTPNQSETQLQGFLTHVEESYTTLSLKPQGDYTAISTGAVNICTVTNKGKEYLFGGISEAFYDKMVRVYDWRDDNVRKKHLIR